MNERAVIGPVLKAFNKVGAPIVIQKRYGCGLKMFVNIPFPRDCILMFCISNPMPFMVKLSYARYAINKAPRMDIEPSTKLNPDRFFRMKTESSITGISVKTGVLAIIIPSFLLCFKVSEMTKVNNGPGDIPAARPNNAPEIRDVMDSNTVRF